VSMYSSENIYGEGLFRFDSQAALVS